jgi:actin-like ATPase involved in cell morphogenesis
LLLRNLLLDALMRPGSVEVVQIRVEHAVELLLMQDEQMIEALTPDTAEEPLTNGIRARGIIRSCKNLDVTRLRHPSEAHPKLVVIITDEVLRSLAIGGGLPQRYVQSRRR